jgi:hypothetical protein
MKISPFFLQLRSAYQAEIDDLTFDSDGQDVLRQRLAARRKEVGFLLQMMELSPEMVAVIFHQGFQFKKPAVMDHLLTHESDEFPEWDSLADAIHLLPAAQDLSRVVLKEPMGEWFLTVAAGLEYMYGKPEGRSAPHDDESDDEQDGDDENRHEGGNSSDPAGGPDGDDERDDRAREEAGADWLAEQGFDRKD